MFMENDILQISRGKVDGHKIIEALGERESMCTAAAGEDIWRGNKLASTVLSGVFCFKGVAYLNQTTTGELKLNATVPALSIVKVSGWPDAIGAETSCGWWGVLIDDLIT